MVVDTKTIRKEENTTRTFIFYTEVKKGDPVKIAPTLGDLSCLKPTVENHSIDVASANNACGA